MMAATYGDDLGDEFAFDDFVADASGGEEGAFSPSDDEDHTGSSGVLASVAGPSTQLPAEDPLRARKRKRREKDKEKRAKVCVACFISDNKFNRPFHRNAVW